MAVCLLGTRWGQYLGSELRNFYRGPLYVCGRDIQRTTRIARQLGAEEPLFAWETAVEQKSILFGSPAGVREDIKGLVAASGCNYVICSFAWGTLSPQQSLRSLRLFADEVMPAFAAG